MGRDRGAEDLGKTFGEVTFMWTATDIVSLAAVIGAAVALINYTNKAFLWLHKTAQQVEDLKSVKEEQRILCLGLSACLDGLIQLGANHNVPKAKKALDDYITSQAHK